MINVYDYLYKLLSSRDKETVMLALFYALILSLGLNGILIVILVRDFIF